MASVIDEFSIISIGKFQERSRKSEVPDSLGFSSHMKTALKIATHWYKLACVAAGLVTQGV